MTYQECLQFLFAQTASYQQKGKSAFKKDLTNIQQLCEILNEPQRSFRSIHIGGTNGKGSTSHLLTSILMEHNYQVGTFTSPHYFDFRERIKSNGNYIPQEKVVEFIELIQDHIRTIQPSFFELTFAMALWYFREVKTEIAVVEVGLGGRLDSTNILSPVLSVITNIGFDHQQFLGNSLKEIAIEKAGIIKESTPIIIGKNQNEIRDLFIAKAEQKNAPILFAEEEQTTKLGDVQLDEKRRAFQIYSKKTKIFEGKTPLLGEYQKENINTSVFAARQLQAQFGLETIKMKLGVENVQSNSGIIGRFQVLGNRPAIIADSSHNAEGIQAFLSQIEQLSTGNIHLIYGCVSDKEVDKIEQLFPKNTLLYLTQPTVERKMPVQKLKQFFPKKDYQSIQSFEHVKSALYSAKERASEEDFILIFGSIFLISDLLQ